MTRPITGSPVIAVYPALRARTPRHFGLNVEIQTHADEINLWDWLADSGTAAAREFHHDLHLRRRAARADAWSDVADAAGFDRYRAGVRARPAEAIDWDNYVFDNEIPLVGTPDRIMEKLRAIGVAPIVNMAYQPRMFPRPLVRDPERLEPATDETIDWPAAVSAYEYYFALMHHFAANYGARFFAMVNEPEYRWGGFYLPPAFDAYPGEELFFKLFVDREDRDLWDTYFEALALQMGALTRFARCALDDVRETLEDRDLAASLQLWGPASANLDAYWPGMAPYVDACDYHQYSRAPHAFRSRFGRAAALVRGTGQRVVITEFNRKGGEMGVRDMLFDMRESVELARVLMEIQALAPATGPDLEATAYYHFHFPATHRNYKSLVYGDMNRVDWTNRDQRADRTGAAFSAADMQVRFATPAYHMFRMLARMSGIDPSSGRGWPVLDTSAMFSDSSRILDITAALHTVAVDQGDRLFVTVLNMDEHKGDAATIDIGALPRPFGWAVVRRTSLHAWDAVVSETAATGNRVALELPPLSMTQVIFSDIDPAAVSDARIVEQTFTPGSLAGLGPWQTTRLRLVATVHGEDRDLSEHNIVWSSDDVGVRADPGGLVQRVGASSGTARITAALADGRVLAEATVAQAEPALAPQSPQAV